MAVPTAWHKVTSVFKVVMSCIGSLNSTVLKRNCVHRGHLNLD